MKIRLEKNGLVKEVKKGFSWTTLFFGCFVPLLRGDLKWAAIMFFAGWLTGGLSAFVFPFIYNKMYIKDLVKDGFRPVGEEDRLLLTNYNIVNEQ